jgi:hypothetical protein
MKKILIAIGIILIWTSTSFAAWTIDNIGQVSYKGHMLIWKVDLTSDGSALSATDLYETRYMPSALKELVNKSLFMYMDVYVNSAPDAGYAITIADYLNAKSLTKYSSTMSTYATSTFGHDLAEDSGYPFQCAEKFLISSEDIGSAGDSITLFFHCWIE